jgi:hypothetical protein
VRFSRQDIAGISVWRGDPDCQAAHSEILTHLREHSTTFLPEGTLVGDRRKGNLGEHIAFRIGAATDFAGWDRQIKNAAEPLSNISSAGIDVTWFLLDPTSADDDVVVIQETKTTPDTSLDLAYKLTADYKKLFARDPSFTLATRLQSLATFLEYERGADKTITHRITNMGAPAAKLASKIRLVPTLLHDSAADGTPRLLAVRTSIAGFGWRESNIGPWSIALSEIGDRLERIAHGRD